MDAARIAHRATQVQLQLGSARAVVIGIDGFGGSGKSTLAAELAVMVPAPHVVAMDDFIVKRRMLEDSWEDAFDRDRLIRQVLEPARDGRAVAYQRLEWASDQLSEPMFVPPFRSLIVEGISALHPQLRDFIDIGVWLDVPVDVARDRGRARDAGTEHEQHWDRWAENDTRYLERHHPEEWAEFLITNG